MSDRIDPKALLPEDLQTMLRVKIEAKLYLNHRTLESRNDFVARYKDYKLVIEPHHKVQEDLLDGQIWIVEPRRAAPGNHVIFCAAVLKVVHRHGHPVTFEEMPRWGIERGFKKREHAGVFDIPIGQKDAGGSNPIYWYEFFEDYDTGEIYYVHCWDGEFSSKEPHSWKDHEWLNRSCYQAIVERCHRQTAEPSRSEIRISGHERAIMQNFTHSRWLESSEGAGDGKESKDGIKGGLVGYCHGIPIICDRDQADDLPALTDVASMQ